LAEGIAGCRSVTVDLDSVQTNLVLAAVDHPVYDIAGFIAALARENIRVIRFGLATVRMALHWEITDKMIERTIAAFHKIDRCQGKPRRKPGRL
jgi:threonine aldolase